MARAAESSSCPGDDLLELLARGEIADQGAELHLRQCGRCRETVQEIQENNRFLASAMPMFRSRERARWGEITAADSIPGYKIIAEIHRGGQGVVYKAYHEPTRRFVAIKLLLQGAFATSRQRYRFEREIEIAAGLRHPNIVTVYDTGALPGGRIGYAMEYVDGVPLDQWVAQAKRAVPAAKGSEVTRALQMLFKICGAIRYAHEHGIIHRDLKPGNILVDGRDEPHILDFGLAKAVGGELDQRERDVTLTRTGEMVGTFVYAAPEQLRGDPHQIDIRTDVYALGVIAYELLTGQLPYPSGGSISDVMRSITQTQPRPPSALCADIADDLDTIILKALTKEPPRRYASAGALLEDLTHYQRGEAIDAKRDSAWYMLRKTAQRHRAALAVATSALAIVLAFAILMTFHAQHLAAERDRTTEALAESILQRASVLTELNDAAGAEKLLWNAALGPLPTTSSAAPRYWPGPAEVYWAMVSLYQRQPCMATIQPSSPWYFAWAHSPTAPIVASGGSNGEIVMWRLDPPRPLRALAGHAGQVWSVQFYAGGSALASAGEDGTVRLWDLTSNAPTRVIELGSKPLRTVNVSPDGTRLVCGDDDGFVYVVDLSSAQVQLRWQTEQQPWMETALDSTGEIVATYARYGDTVRLWSVATGQQIAESDLGSPNPEGDQIVAAAFVPGESKLAIGYLSGLTDLWDWRTTNVRRGIKNLGDLGPVISPDGTLIAGCSVSDRTVRITPLAQLDQTTRLAGHAGLRPLHVLFDPRQEYLLSVDANGVVKKWDLNLFGWREALRGHEDTIFSIQLSPDQTTLASASNDHSIILWDYKSKKLRQTLRGPNAGATALAFSPDGSLLASGSHKEEPAILLWDVASGQLIRRFDGHIDWITSLCFSPDGRLLVSGSAARDGTVRLWRVASGEELARHWVSGLDPYCCVTFSHRGGIVAWSEADGALVLADTNLERPRRLTGHTIKVRSLVFSSDDTLLASASDDLTVRVWDVASGVCRHVLQGHSSGVYGLAFSADTKLVASGDYLGMVRLWDVATGRLLLTTREPAGGCVFSILFADHDRSLVCAGTDREIAIRDLSYYDRHIAGNTLWQVNQRLSSEFDQGRAASLKRWAEQVSAGRFSTADP